MIQKITATTFAFMISMTLGGASRAALTPLLVDVEVEKRETAYHVHISSGSDVWFDNTLEEGHATSIQYPNRPPLHFLVNKGGGLVFEEIHSTVFDVYFKGNSPLTIGAKAPLIQWFERALHTEELERAFIRLQHHATDLEEAVRSLDSALSPGRSFASSHPTPASTPFGPGRLSFASLVLPSGDS